jgi:hypothetical protein
MAGQLTLTLDRASRPQAPAGRAAVEAVTPLPTGSPDGTAAPVWVRRITTAAVLAVAAVASYESPYVKWCW